MTIEIKINGKEICFCDICNVTQRQEHSRYVVSYSKPVGEKGRRIDGRFEINHNRSEGAVVLARKVLDKISK
jgi:hypothetical protein